MRADDRIDDRSALAEMGEADAGYVEKRAAQWESDAMYSWAVCEPTTGEMFAEVTIDPVAATVRTRARDGHTNTAAIAEQFVRRFAVAVLGLTLEP